ncbi:MAG: zinc ribbon domain-containing protein [Candidatus Omnitrophota bacterium]
MGNTPKVCPKCNAKNNPLLNVCWKCKTSFYVSDLKQKEVVSDGMKKCKFCAEEVLAEAIKCKHCGSMLELVETKKDTRKCMKCNMEIPKGGIICPYCRKEPGCLGAMSSLAGNLMVLGLIVLSFFMFPGFWAAILAIFLSAFHK